jgi:hypothetical protein
MQNLGKSLVLWENSKLAIIQHYCHFRHIAMPYILFNMPGMMPGQAKPSLAKPSRLGKIPQIYK